MRSGRAEDDLDAAIAETVVRRAGRVPAAREANGWWHTGRAILLAPTESSGPCVMPSGSHLLPLMVDCERGLGRASALWPSRPVLRPGSWGRRSRYSDRRPGVRRDLALDAAVLKALSSAFQRVRLGPGAPASTTPMPTPSRRRVTLTARANGSRWQPRPTPNSYRCGRAAHQVDGIIAVDRTMTLMTTTTWRTTRMRTSTMLAASTRSTTSRKLPGPRCSTRRARRGAGSGIRRDRSSTSTGSPIAPGCSGRR